MVCTAGDLPSNMEGVINSWIYQSYGINRQALVLQWGLPGYQLLGHWESWVWLRVLEGTAESYLKVIVTKYNQGYCWLPLLCKYSVVLLRTRGSFRFNLLQLFWSSSIPGKAMDRTHQNGNWSSSYCFFSFFISSVSIFATTSQYLRSAKWNDLSKSGSTSHWPRRCKLFNISMANKWLRDPY